MTGTSVKILEIPPQTYRGFSFLFILNKENNTQMTSIESELQVVSNFSRACQKSLMKGKKQLVSLCDNEVCSAISAGTSNIHVMHWLVHD